ncbi:MAG: hypothetical protein Fur005_10630 [Roseiflexaceae bacterium]
MRRKTIIALILSLACCGSLLSASFQATAANDDIPSFYVDDQLLPPIISTQNTANSNNYMLELESSADPAIVEQQAVALGGSLLYHTQLAYNGIAITIPDAARVDQLAAIPGVKAVHVLPTKQRLRTRAVNTPATEFVIVGREVSSDTESQSNTQEALESTTPATEVTTIQAVTGRGVRIGIIDSGVDYTHATFGGAGTIAAYDANNPALIEAGSFPTSKVAGGIDFAGDSYDADGRSGSASPTPDSDPLDCRATSAATLNRGGHGTFVAATAAGFGVVGGNTYTGGYTAGMDTSTFDLAPGVAPDATIYAFKVFGCRGSTALLGQAIEYALDPNSDGDYSDRLVDVLNIAVGSPFGGADDPDAQAIDKAVALGVTVVVAIGDGTDSTDSNTFYSMSSPGSASGAVTVGAIGSNGEIFSRSLRGPQRGQQAIKPDLVAPGGSIRSASAGSGNATVTMEGTSAAAAIVTGAAALALEANPTWQPEHVKAALINSATPLESNANIAYPASMAGAGQLNLNKLIGLKTLAYVDGEVPLGGISYGFQHVPAERSFSQNLTIYNGESNGRALALTSIVAVDEPGVTLQVPSDSVTVPAKSSITVPVTLTVNPSLLNETPDPFTPITQAPLDRYYLSEHSGFVQVGSVDFARIRAAHIAATTGLNFFIDRRQIGRELYGTQIGSFEVVAPGRHIISILPRGATTYGSARPIIEREVVLEARRDYTFTAIGGGSVLYLSVQNVARQNPSGALGYFINGNMNTAVDVCIDGNIIARNVGFNEVVGPIGINTGTQEVKFYATGTTTLVATKTITPRSGHTIFAGAAQGSYSCRSGDCNPAQLGFAATSWNIILPPISLNVPYQVFPKPASQVAAASSDVFVNTTSTSFTIPLMNSGIRNQPTSTQGSLTPLTAAFLLTATSPEIVGSATPSADIRYVGVTNTYSVTRNVSSATIFFATTTFAPWSTPNEVEVRIYIDSTGPSGRPDGIDDYVIRNTSFSTLSGRQMNDTFVSPLYQIDASGNLNWLGTSPGRYNSLPSPSTSPFVDVAPYNSTVMFQLIGARLIGLSATQPSFNYHIETRYRDAGNYSQVVDRVPATGSLIYNLTTPSVAPINSVRGTPNLVQRPLFVSVNGAQVTAAVNPAILADESQPARVLLLHLHNPVATQAELVTVNLR